MTIEAKLLDEQEQIEAVAGGIPGETGATIAGLLFEYIRPRKLGRVFNAQTDFELPGVGKRQPDVAFVAMERLPRNTFEAVPLAPDLVVEVASKTDDLYDIEDKAFDYLKAGVRLVWVVRPKHKLIEVYRPNQPVRLLNATDELDGADVLPGFKIKINEIFDY